MLYLLTVDLKVKLQPRRWCSFVRLYFHKRRPINGVFLFHSLRSITQTKYSQSIVRDLLKKDEISMIIRFWGIPCFNTVEYAWQGSAPHFDKCQTKQWMFCITPHIHKIFITLIFTSFTSFHSSLIWLTWDLLLWKLSNSISKNISKDELKKQIFQLPERWSKVLKQIGVCGIQLNFLMFLNGYIEKKSSKIRQTFQMTQYYTTTYKNV